MEALTFWGVFVVGLCAGVGFGFMAACFIVAER